jgi:LPS sulfotransferase NodH
MIAALPRSGSTAFCLDLWRTGLLGAPLEYTNLELMREDRRWRKLLRRELHFWRELQRLRTGPNGVFSYKFFVMQYVELLNDKPNLLTHITPTHVVFFTRKDKLSQAISYSKAMRSGAWFADAPTERRCEYDAAHIEQCQDLISRQEQTWEHVFDITNTSPLRVEYEAFLSAPSTIVQSILQYVAPGSLMRQRLQIPQIEIQRDALSEEWRQRFLESGNETGEHCVHGLS